MVNPLNYFGLSRSCQAFSSIWMHKLLGDHTRLGKLWRNRSTWSFLYPGNTSSKVFLGIFCRKLALVNLRWRRTVNRDPPASSGRTRSLGYRTLANIHWNCHLQRFWQDTKRSKSSDFVTVSLVWCDLSTTYAPKSMNMPGQSGTTRNN
jgi:hypothetical protein